MGGGKTPFTVQALRAFAASSVVVHHIMIVAVQKAGYQYSFPSTAAAGVDLFFLISGFIMVYTHFDDFGKAGASASFIRRRLIQIVPLYWIAATVAVALLIVIPSAFSTLKLDWQNVLFSYLFLLSRTSNGGLNTILVTGWSTCYEIYFYALFALLLFLPRRMFLIAGGAIFAVGLTSDAAGSKFHHGQPSQQIHSCSNFISERSSRPVYSRILSTARPCVDRHSRGHRSHRDHQLSRRQRLDGARCLLGGARSDHSGVGDFVGEKRIARAQCPRLSGRKLI